MKTRITNYTFSAASKQITFLDYPSINLDGILLITNVTNNIIIYNFADALFGGTVSTNILTLSYDTVAMSNTDKLQIFYDDGIYPASDATQALLMEMIENDDGNIKKLLQLLKPLGIIVSGSGRLSVDINAITTLPTLSTVTTVGTVTTVTSMTNLVNIGGLNALDEQVNISKIAWGVGLRSNLTF